MLNKVLLVVVLFQLFITMTMADPCSLFYTGSGFAKGPSPVEPGRCFPTNSSDVIELAWMTGNPLINNIPGYLKFYSGGNCEPNTIIDEGRSPVYLTKTASTGSIFVESCS